MESAFLSGQMLIAMPGIGDPRFERSLILVCAHDGAHAMGIAVNRPVEIERGFVLHTDDYHAEHSVGVEGGLALTTTREVLEAMGRHNQSPRKAILALGYSGWGAGQLEREIRENVWLTVDADEALVFDDDYDTKWTRALGKLGIDPQFLSAEAGRA